jgi:phospholipid/cholesterol/gamma-HCH transport system substrate-binding protein
VKLLAVLIGLGALLTTGAGVWDQLQPYEVTGYFMDADQLVAGNDVVMNGTPAGTVDSVTVAPESSAAGVLVKLKIDSRFAPLRQGTRATIRPKGVLGVMYVELQPGGGKPIPRGGAIPLHDTASPVTLDEVNDLFDPATRERIHTLTIEGGLTFQGRGQDVNTLLTTLPALSRDAQDISAALAVRDQEISDLQVEFDRVASMMAAEADALKQDLASGASILNVMAAHEQKLQEELIYANQALSKLNAALGGHTQDLNQILKDFPALLNDLKRFQSDSTTSLSILYPCIGDILGTLNEMQDATKYQSQAGSGDGQGFELRVDSPVGRQSVGAEHPLASCSGAQSP